MTEADDDGRRFPDKILTGDEILRLRPNLLSEAAAAVDRERRDRAALVGVTPDCALCVFWASRLRPSGHDWCARHAMTPQHARGDEARCGAEGRSFTARGEG